MAVAILAGCSSSNGRASSPTTVERSSTSTTVTGEIAEVIARYKAAEYAGARAGMIPDPDYPELLATEVDPILRQSRDVYRGYQLRKVAYRYPEPLERTLRITVDPATVEVTGDTAVLEACAVDPGARVELNSSTTTAAPSPTTVLVKAGMRRDAGVWKLAERQTLQSWKGVAGCAAS